jgi:hypothetical protein
MTASNTGQARAPRRSASQRRTVGVTSMASFMAGMDALVVTTALPTIHADLAARPTRDSMKTDMAGEKVANSGGAQERGTGPGGGPLEALLLCSD